MKRQTKHIRIDVSNHKRLKQLSVDAGKTISVIADEIIEKHFLSKERPLTGITLEKHEGDFNPK